MNSKVLVFQNMPIDLCFGHPGWAAAGRAGIRLPDLSSIGLCVIDFTQLVVFTVKVFQLLEYSLIRRGLVFL